MNLADVFDESIDFTRATLFGKWSRWLILILLGLPWALIPFTIDPERLIDRSGIHWDLIPWGQIAILAAAGFVLSIFAMGYAVRIFRSGNTPPEFNKWGGLARDGMGVSIITLIWALPIQILLLLQIFFMVGGGFSVGLLLLFPVLMIFELLFLIAIVLFLVISIIRFAHTGRIGEAFDISGIWSDIGRIGWFNYIITLIVVAVIGIIFSQVASYLAIIPFAGVFIAACLKPLVDVFSYRFMAGVYDARGIVPGTETSGEKPEDGASAIQVIKYVLMFAGVLAIWAASLVLIVIMLGGLPFL